MRDVISRMDVGSNGSKSRSNNDKPGQSVKRHVVGGVEQIWIITIGIALLLFDGPAFGQFTVQPMKLELAITPGKMIKSELNVKSYDPNETYNIKMSTTDLSQVDNAEWAIIEPNDITDPNSPFFGFDLSKLSSCKDWISLSPNVINLSPNGTQPVEVSMGVGNVSVVLRFYIPVILEVQDKPARTKVDATDVGLKLLERTAPNGQYQAVSLATMDIENSGGS
jgi:hypothetical protein